MGGLDVLTAHGRHHEQPRARLHPQQVVQEPAGLPVGVLEVVHDQEQRLRAGDHDRGDRVEQPPPLIALGQRAGGARSGISTSSSGTSRASSVSRAASRRGSRVRSAAERSQLTTGA